MTPVRRTVIAAVVASLVMVSDAAGAPITPETVAILTAWVDAVKTHSPGQSDEAVATVAAFSYDTREQMNAGIEFFLHVLLGGGYDTKRNRATQMVAELAHGAGTPDADSFLKRAAILHSDVASYADRFPRAPTDPAGSNATRPVERQIHAGNGMAAKLESDEVVPPLLTRDRLLLSLDGQVVGEAAASWNWPFARRLLDLVGAGRRGLPDGRRPRLATDPFVAAWYHATTAYMFDSGWYGDATAHLEHGGEVLPANAMMAFDRGCYAEIMGLPMHQALLSERDVTGRRLDDASSGAPTWKPPSADAPLRMPSLEKTNAEAERWYRRALAIDPALIEARVRLARLLTVRRRYEDAAGELKIALAGEPTGVVAYYAHLFAGRAARALGQAGDAARHYEEAAALFPDAQSPRLGASQLALLGADVPATLAPIEHLGPGSAVYTADPWWQYHLGAGRDASWLLRSFWAGAPR